jgi:hypothetical protein
VLRPRPRASPEVSAHFEPREASLSRSRRQSKELIHHQGPPPGPGSAQPGLHRRSHPEGLDLQAGVKPITWSAVGGELQGDWRNPTGQELAKIMGEHLPFYGNLMGSFSARAR